MYMVARIVAAGLITLFANGQPRQQTPAQETATPPDGVALLKRASVLHAEGKYQEAISMYDRALPRLPQIADWIGIFAASSASHLGDTAQVRRRLAPLDNGLREWAWRSRARAFQKAGAAARAIEIARAATRSDRISARSDAWYMLAELRGTLSPAERLEAGRAHMRNSDVSVGIREIERALASGELSAKVAGETRYELGRVLFSSGKYPQAKKQLERVPRGHARRPDARFLLGRTYYRMGRSKEGKQLFRDVAELYPSTTAATRALFFLADLAHDDGDTAEAARLFERTANAVVKTDESSLAMMRSGGIAFQQKNYQKAYATFEAYRTRHPKGAYLGQATYWAAQSASRTGNRTRANELLRSLRNAGPVSYYGMRAASQLGDSTLIADLPAGPQTGPGTAKAVSVAVDRWQLLREIEWNEAASFDLGRIRKRFAANAPALYALAEELNQRGASHLAIAIGRDLLDSGTAWDERLLKILYPMPYEALIKREARAHGLDPYFVAALIRQESRFNKDARSGAGAIGLMQVMPATGRQLRRKAGVGTVTPQSLTQPSLNVKLGTLFLADVMSQYRGRPDLALIAYNAGPTRAARWKSLPEFGSQELFIERIPFDETRDYVKIVTLNTAIYRSLYPTPVAGD